MCKKICYFILAAIGLLAFAVLATKGINYMLDNWIYINRQEGSSDVSLILGFVGVLTTFVVIGNYAQVKNVEEKMDRNNQKNEDKLRENISNFNKELRDAKTEYKQQTKTLEERFLELKIEHNKQSENHNEQIKKYTQLLIKQNFNLFTVQKEIILKEKQNIGDFYRTLDVYLDYCDETILEEILDVILKKATVPISKVEYKFMAKYFNDFYLKIPKNHQDFWLEAFLKQLEWALLFMYSSRKNVLGIFLFSYMLKVIYIHSSEIIKTKISGFYALLKTKLEQTIYLDNPNGGKKIIMHKDILNGIVMDLKNTNLEFPYYEKNIDDVILKAMNELNKKQNL